MKKAIIAISALAISLAALPAAYAGNTGVTADYSSYSIEQLTALIAQLTKQLEEMKKGSAACFVSSTDLFLGDGEPGDDLSDDVERLQAFLREKGYFTFHKNTGFFGKVTRNALISFQKDQALAETGEFDSATREKAHAMTCAKTTTSTVKNETKAVKGKAATPSEKAETKTATETKKKEEKNTEQKKEEKTSAANASVVTSIAAHVDGAVVSWEASGTSKHGFKIVWSKTAHPTYPLRSSDKYIYLAEPSATQTTLTAFDGEGTYHVRVCEYLGGSCGTYSNELEVEL